MLERAINHLRALYALRIYNDWGVPTVNTYEVANTCGDKLLTTAALMRHGVPSPRTLIAFTPESALEAIEELGYPVVLKPAVGSWGRLLAKVNDRDAAEALLEHKVTLGSFHHGAFYIQEYVEKAGRDIRAFVVGDETICAIYRDSRALDHQHRPRRRGQQLPGHAGDRRDLARGGRERSAAAWWRSTSSRRERGLLVNEVNYTMEFRNSIDTTGVNIPAKIVDYVIQVGEAGRARAEANGRVRGRSRRQEHRQVVEADQGDATSLSSRSK